MSKGGIVVLIVAAVVFAALGFVFGQVVQAAVSSPGSQEDPLVTSSYVETYVGNKLLDMQLKIDELESAIIQMGGSVGDLDTTPDSDGTDIPTPDNGGTGGTTADPDITSGTNETGNSSGAFSTVTVKESSVNVRSETSTETSDNIVGNVAANTVLTYLGQKNDSEGRAWYKVRLENGQEGWVAGWLCNDPQ